jgi:error-prone DNA polymerase
LVIQGSLTGTTTGERAPMLPGMDEVERMVADIWATGLSPVAHPVQFARDHLTRVGAVAIADLPRLEHGRRVFVGGIVTLVVRGMLEKVEGVLNLRADHLATLALPVRSPSRDFR